MRVHKVGINGALHSQILRAIERDRLHGRRMTVTAWVEEACLERLGLPQADVMVAAKAARDAAQVATTAATKAAAKLQAARAAGAKYIWELFGYRTEAEWREARPEEAARHYAEEAALKNAPADEDEDGPGDEAIVPLDWKPDA